MAWLVSLFNEQGLPPHGFCLLWQPGLILLHAISDGVIGFAYYLIPIALAWFIHQRRDVVFGWIFWMFAAFILACGTTHFMEIWVLWHPDYGVQGVLKAVTAVVSLATAVLLWPLIPRALALPTTVQFQHVAEMLSRESAERERTLGQLQQSEATFRLLVDSITDYAIYMLDPRGCVTTWNTGAERIKGYSAADILGQHFARFYTTEDQDAGVPGRALEIAANSGRYEWEGWHVRKDGTRLWAHVVMHPLSDRSGQIVGFAKITRDLTERQEAEQALEQTRAHLAQAQKMEAIGQLTGGVAHDFNNLLTAVLGSVELLRLEDPQPNADTERLLGVIQHAAERGATLTSRLLAFSRRQALMPRATDLNRLVRNMSELLRQTLGEQITIESVLAGGLWTTFVDQNQLENSILNLAVNARDAMPSGGRLTIETGNTWLDEDYASAHEEVAPGQYVLVAVSDTGEGMTEEELRQAFEPFYTTKDEGKGTGLGLSQVYGFVKQSHGHVKLYSEKGHGTTVKIYLPRHIVAAGVATSACAMPAPAAIPHGVETVLVVEDDDDVRKYSAEALTHLGYFVLQAQDGDAALRMLETHPGIVLLFTDIGLPGMNGRQLADEAMRRAPGLKVIFTTGYARNAIVHHGVLDSGIYLLPKPFTIEGLARMVRNVLESRRPLRHLFDRGDVPGQRGAPDVAHFGPVEPARPVHRRAIVPDHQVVDPPLMRIDEAFVGRELGQIAEEHARFRNGPALDGAGMRRQEQGPAASDRMRAHQALADRPERRAFLGRQVGEPDRLAGEHQGVFADQILDLGFGPRVQRVIGGTHIGKVRVGAPRWDDPAGQQRVFRRYRTERAVRVP
jgi:PAS domain S-box-containing protein